MKLHSKCEICKQNLHKYKCPICLLLYCSLDCYKQHKSDAVCAKKEILAPSELSTSSKTELMIEDDERLCAEKLALLEKSEALKNIVSNPHLQTILISLDSSKDKNVFIEKCMQEPIFIEFADKCLSVVR